jgi:hypothetical protein
MRTDVVRRGLALLAGTLLTTLLLAIGVASVLAESPLPSAVSPTAGGAAAAVTTAAPGEGYITTFQQHGPSALVMIVVVLLGSAASLAIIGLNKRAPGGP